MKNIYFLVSIFLLTISNLKSSTEKLLIPQKSKISNLQQSILLMDFQNLENIKDTSKFNLADFLLNLFQSQKSNLEGTKLKKILKFIQTMIDRGSDVKIKTSIIDSNYDFRGRAIHVACDNGCKEIVEILIKAKANINSTAFYIFKKNTNTFRRYVQAIHLACNKGNKEIVELLIKSGARINDKTRDTNTNSRCRSALHIACDKGNKEIVEILIKSGANVNTISKDSNFSFETPLQSACHTGNIEIVELLVKSGADVSLGSYYTALHIACEEGHNEIVELLIENGAHINKKSKNDYRSLDLACKNKHKETIYLLFSYGASIQLCRNEFKNELQNLFNQFLDNLIEENFYTKKDFIQAIQNENIGQLKLILKSGFSVNQILENGDSPLHFAVRKKSLPVVKFLVDSGADIHLKNDNGKTPLDLCYEIGNKENSTLLLISEYLSKKDSLPIAK